MEKYRASGTVLSIFNRHPTGLGATVQLETAAQKVQPGDHWVMDCASRDLDAVAAARPDDYAEHDESDDYADRSMREREAAVSRANDQVEKYAHMLHEAIEQRHATESRMVHLRANLALIQDIAYMAARSDWPGDHPLGTSCLNPAFDLIRQMLTMPEEQSSPATEANYPGYGALGPKG